MTKPEQMLKLAQIVEPDKEWKIVEGDILALGPFNTLWVNAEMFDPENNDAQRWSVLVKFLKVELNNPACTESIQEIAMEHIKHDRIDDFIELALQVICRD